MIVPQILSAGCIRVSVRVFAFASLLTLAALALMFALAHLLVTTVHWSQLALFCLVNAGCTLLQIERTNVYAVPVDEIVITVLSAMSTPLPRTKIDDMSQTLATLTPIPKCCFVPTFGNAS